MLGRHLPFAFRALHAPTGFWPSPVEPLFPEVFGPLASEPAAHGYEQDDRLTLEFEVPRYRAAELTVVADPATGVVEVRGERAPPGGAGGAWADGHLLFGAATPTSFRRAFRLSPRVYDLAKVTYAVTDGVLAVTVPKLPEPPAPETHTLFDGAAALRPPQAPPAVTAGPAAGTGAAPAAGAAGTVATTATTAADDSAAVVSQLSRARWPPATKVEESGEQYTYGFALPAGVRPENIKVTLTGRTLTLSLHAGHSDHGDGYGARHVTYSQSLQVPAGTTADRVHTAFEAGKFKIAIDKVPAAAGAGAAEQHVKVAGPAEA